MYRTGFAACLIALGIFGTQANGALQCGHHGAGGCRDCGECDEDGCGHHGYWQGSANPRQSSQVTREGQVMDLIYLPGETAAAATIELRLKAGAESVLTRLGPGGFLRMNGIDIRDGDMVSVTGYWAQGPDGDLLVATRVVCHNKSLDLRDRWGHSLWGQNSDWK